MTAATTRAGLVALPLPLGALALLIGAGRMPHRTPAGTAVLRRAQGFRRFIEESDRERIRYGERQNLFEEYLPYAVVFGATEKWAKAFAGLDGEPRAPSWYIGGGGSSGGGAGGGGGGSW